MFLPLPLNNTGVSFLPPLCVYSCPVYPLPAVILPAAFASVLRPPAASCSVLKFTVCFFVQTVAGDCRRPSRGVPPRPCLRGAPARPAPIYTQRIFSFHSYY